MRPGIELSIDKVILDGVRVAPHERAGFLGALEAELTRLLTEYGLPEPGREGPDARAVAPLRLPGPAADTATRVAHQVYLRIGGAQP